MAGLKTIHASSAMAFCNNKMGLSNSSAQKAERQKQRDGEVGYWEEKKAGLKGKACGSLEAIEERLKLLQSYEDGIAAAKATYNREQMFHVLDEAREQAEKIAKEAEKYEPKTPEERREEMAEEQGDTEESKGELTESLEELADAVKDAAEEFPDTKQEQLEELDGEEDMAEKEEEAKHRHFNMWV